MDGFKTNPLFGMLPADLSGPLGELFDTITDVSGKLKDGANIGIGYVDQMEDQLKAIEHHIKSLKNAGLDAGQLLSAKTEIGRLLKISESMVDTPENVKRVNHIYKRLAKIQPKV